MFKRLFVVALFIVLSATILPEVVKADAYEYENINELADSVASVINKKNIYAFKYKFSRSDFYMDFDVTVNWKTKAVIFNGFIFRSETNFKKEKFSATLNLKNNKVKTASKAYKKGRNVLSNLIEVWSFEEDIDYMNSLGNYLLDVLPMIGQDTTISKSGNKVVLENVTEAKYTTCLSTIIIDKSKVIKMEAYDIYNVIKIVMK